MCQQLTALQYCAVIVWARQSIFYEQKLTVHYECYSLNNILYHLRAWNYRCEQVCSKHSVHGNKTQHPITPDPCFYEEQERMSAHTALDINEVRSCLPGRL